MFRRTILWPALSCILCLAVSTSSAISETVSSTSKDLLLLPGPKGRKGKRGKKGRKTHIQRLIIRDALHVGSTKSANPVFVDDFTTGGVKSGTIGSLGWNRIYSDPTYTNTEDGHSGVLVIPSYAGIQLNHTTGSVHNNQNFDLRVVMKQADDPPLPHKETAVLVGSAQAYFKFAYDGQGNISLHGYSKNGASLDFGIAPSKGTWFGLEIQKIGTGIDFVLLQADTDPVIQHVEDDTFNASDQMYVRIVGDQYSWETHLDYVSLELLDVSRQF